MEMILKPFVWLLLFFYNMLGNYGLALIIFAVIIKLILFPVSLKAKKSMIQTSMLSGKMQQLQKQYGKDRERYNLEVQKMYEQEKVNPMGGCVWSLIPMVLLIALYYIIREPVTHLMGVSKDMIEVMAEVTGVANVGAYPQISMAKALNDPEILAAAQAALGEGGAKLFSMDFSFLGLSLADIPTWKFWEGGITGAAIGLTVLPLVSTVVSFLSMRVTMNTNKINNKMQNDQMERTNKMMLWTMPLMSLWIGFTVPAGLTVYWIAQYLINMVQEIICAKLLKKDYEAARIASEARERQEKEEEKQRKEEARLERANRIEEDKKNRGKKKPQGKKDVEPEQAGVDKNDSREGIRAYARGRAYVPGRFGGATTYGDRTAETIAQADARSMEEEEQSFADQELAAERAERQTMEQMPHEEYVAPEQQANESEEVEEIELDVDEENEP